VITPWVVDPPNGCWLVEEPPAGTWEADGCTGTDLWLPGELSTSVAMEAIAGYAVAGWPITADEGWTLPPADATAPVCA